MNTNKTILITGAAKNLGKHIAEHYLKKKFNVISIYRKSKPPSIVNSYKCNLSDAKQTDNLFTVLKKSFVKIDFIVSCAGASKKTYKVNENINDWKLAFDNNFYCFTNLLESYVKFYKKKTTKIVVISSIASNKITNAPITYAVAKTALNQYVQIKAKELAKDNIKINLLLPGNILMKNNNWGTKIKKDKKKIKKYIKDNVPLNTFCNPEQISDMCDYLFRKSGDNITGSKFTIDGGESL